jgi:integrase/recombinase XerC
VLARLLPWLGREGLVASNRWPMCAPQGPRPLPKALAVDEAVRLAEHAEPDDDPWLEARDAAMVELLYGSGLRVGELVGLDLRPSPEARPGAAGSS